MNDKILKVNYLEKDKALEVIYMWIKQNAITLSEFKILLNYIKQ